MLTLNRKDGESILIYPRDLDPETTVQEPFAGGPIVIRVHGRKNGGTGVGIEATVELEVLREELKVLVASSRRIIRPAGDIF